MRPNLLVHNRPIQRLEVRWRQVGSPVDALVVLEEGLQPHLGTYGGVVLVGVEEHRRERGHVRGGGVYKGPGLLPIVRRRERVDDTIDLLSLAGHMNGREREPQCRIQRQPTEVEAAHEPGQGGGREWIGTRKVVP